MKNFLRISLLLLLAVRVFPWQMVCVAHPGGHRHSHHPPGEISPCELRKLHPFAGLAFWPPMHCATVVFSAGEMQQSFGDELKPPVFDPALPPAASFFSEKTVAPRPAPLPPYAPRDTSDPPLPTNTLRGPPLV